MYSIYRAPKQKHTGRTLLIVLAVIAVVLGGLGYGGYRYYQANPELAGFFSAPAPEAQPASGQEASETAPLDNKNVSKEGSHIDRDLFTIDLPVNWSFGTYEQSPYKVYNFISTGNKSGERSMKIYADTIPEKQLSSRSVTVKPQGNRLTHGLASERCTTLGAADASGLKQYDGAGFYCDIAEKDPGTVGTSAAGTPNKIRLTSLSSGLHDFYFVYTDTTPQQDYDLFYKMLNSFSVK